MLNKRSTLMVLALLLAPFVLVGCSEKTTSPLTSQEDTVPPLAPTAWQPRADGGNTTLRWARNTETDLAGYNVYWYDPNPNNPNSYVALTSQPTVTNSYPVPGLAPGTTYYFKTTAVDMSGNESGYSQVMAVTVEVSDQDVQDSGYPELDQE
jgi:uncharacterized protein YcfL